MDKNKILKKIEESGHFVYKAFDRTDIILNEQYEINVKLLPEKNIKIRFRRGFRFERTKYGFTILKNLYIIENDSPYIAESREEFEEYIFADIIKEEDKSKYIAEKLYKDVFFDEDLYDTAVYELKRKNIVFDEDEDYTDFLMKNPLMIKKALMRGTGRESADYVFYEDKIIDVIGKKIDEIEQKNNTIVIEKEKIDIRQFIEHLVEKEKVFQNYDSVKKAIKHVSFKNVENGIKAYIRTGILKTPLLIHELEKAFEYSLIPPDEENLASIINEISVLIRKEEDETFACSVLINTAEKYFNEKMSFKKFKKYLSDISMSYLIRGYVFNMRFNASNDAKEHNRKKERTILSALILSESLKRKHLDSLTAIPTEHMIKNLWEKKGIDEIEIDTLIKHDVFILLNFYINTMKTILRNADYLNIEDVELIKLLNNFLDIRIIAEKIGNSKDKNILYLYGILQHNKKGELIKVAPEDRKKVFSKNLSKIDKKFKEITEKGLSVFIKRMFEKYPSALNEYGHGSKTYSFQNDVFEEKSEYLERILTSVGIGFQTDKNLKKMKVFIQEPEKYLKHLKVTIKNNNRKFNKKDVYIALGLHMNERYNGILNPVSDNDVIYYDEIFGAFENLKNIKKEFESLKIKKPEPVKETESPK